MGSDGTSSRAVQGSPHPASAIIPSFRQATSSSQASGRLSRHFSARRCGDSRPHPATPNGLRASTVGPRSNHATPFPTPWKRAIEAGDVPSSDDAARTWRPIARAGFCSLCFLPYVVHAFVLFTPHCSRGSIFPRTTILRATGLRRSWGCISPGERGLLPPTIDELFLCFSSLTPHAYAGTHGFLNFPSRYPPGGCIRRTARDAIEGACIDRQTDRSG